MNSRLNKKDVKNKGQIGEIKMKKIIGIVLIAVMVLAFVGCKDKGSEVHVSVADIVSSIKGQIAADLKAGGVPEEVFKESEVPGYMVTDFMKEDQNPMLESFNKADLEEGFALQQMMNVKSDLIIVLEAKDKAKVESIKTALGKIKEQQINTWSTYLPDQYEKVQKNIIKAEGNYLIYITYDNPEKIEELFTKALK